MKKKHVLFLLALIAAIILSLTGCMTEKEGGSPPSYDSAVPAKKVAPQDVPVQKNTLVWMWQKKT